MTRIAIVGMACRYPDAASPRELWENALAGRRAFRRLPDVRMRLEDYWDPDPAAPDRFYARHAAVIEGYEFDRIAYKVAGSTYRATDLTHWLALDVAAQALADAGFPMAEGLPRERTGVVVGNSLTGEFSRANQLRLRWPFVRRMLAAALKEQDWDDDQLAAFLDGFETKYKDPFPPVDEDSLAGGLSNTIAGRICNHFDLKGGGYTVDGACSSSLLSVVTAGKTLLAGEVDVAVAGGVDLSIDPFEIIGFAKTGALATGEMRVYDRGSNGFWPGEGCGMVVLMREADARAAGHRVYATVAGWGISSDGRGGITRPEVAGYGLALRRAYERAGFGIETVSLFEGHGTGTKVGDATELRALARARLAADPRAEPAAIGSIKGMIGHTKAAAGIAGLIKAAMAVHHQVLPPAIGCVEPHEVITEPPATLRVLRKAQPWPSGAPVRAGVTAMGFGGINTHLVLENTAPRPRTSLDARTTALACSAQDAELLLVDAASPEELRERLDRLIDFVPVLAYAQLADLAVTLHSQVRDLPYRAAAVVSSPDDAQTRLRRIREALDAGETTMLSTDGRSMLGHAAGPGRIGFLFPGQGSGRGVRGGALRRRFAEVEAVYLAAGLPEGGDGVATEVAQPRIVTGSMAGLRALSLLGIEATVALGHSLGELSALCWAGAMDEKTLLEVATIRGRTMAEHSASGTMAGIGGSPDAVAGLLDGLPAVVAGYNGPRQTVVAGAVNVVEQICRRAGEAGLPASRLSVSHAFHSPLVAPAADAFGDRLAGFTFAPLRRRVVSTVCGEILPPDTDVPALLRRQITEPVLFSQALELAAKDIDLFIEVGPGRVLTGLAGTCAEVPAVALDTDDESLTGLLRVVGAAYVLGAARVDDALFHGRLVRPLQVGAQFSFFANPCEKAPIASVPIPSRGGSATASRGQAVSRAGGPRAGAAPAGTRPGEPDRPTAEQSTMELLRELTSRRAELPLEMVGPDSLLLDDLHLSSITVGQVVNQAAQALGVPPAQTPTNFASATLGQLADALDSLASTAHGGGSAAPAEAAGAAGWVRAWAVDLLDAATPAVAQPESGGSWRVHAPADHPLAQPLRAALTRAGLGGGVLVCLPTPCRREDLASALDGAKEAAAGPGTRFVLVQHGPGAAGMAKTLRLEAPHLRVTVVDTPPVPDAVDRVLAEVAATTGFTEAHYDGSGIRRVPTLRVLPDAPAVTAAPLAATDVLLVTGGGKGITAECALALATDHGCKLAVLGRSDPAADADLSANLARMSAAGITVRYWRADVTDRQAVRRAVARAGEELGPVTAVLHGAGRNEPRALSGLDSAAVARTFAPKVDGLRTVLDAVDPAQLRLLVSFGSIIGRAGLRGEAHYATANEWLAALTEQYGRDHPHCRTMCLEWSVWSGVGMGERLSVVESLAREGTTPVSPDDGVRILRRLLADPGAPTTVVVSGRTGGADTLRYDRPALPLLRFVERPLVHYPGVELVTEVELTAGTDRYLADHLLDGNLLFPAVFGMEAMAQVASALTGRSTVAAIEEAEFTRPIVVPPDGAVTLRIAALATDDDTVRVVIRSSETGYAAEHFGARLRMGSADAPAGPPDQASDGLPPVPLDPATDLYGGVLFQGERFQRLRRYHRAAARDVDAEVTACDAVSWFAGFLPDTLLLGDPGVRDALMHGNQVCVPDATLLPAGIDRLHPAGPRLSGDEVLRYCARERSQDGDTYVYDIALRTGAGEVVERWEGLRLRAVRRTDGAGPWVPALLGPYLERTVEDLTGTRVSVAVEPGGAGAAGAGQGPRGAAAARKSRRAGTTLAAGRALGRPATVRYRPDGRPELDGGPRMSAAHGVGITLCVVGAAPPDRDTGPSGGDTGPLGCDLEPVVGRTSGDWTGLLGRHLELARQVAAATGESVDSAATRVWTAVECLQKIGRAGGDPLVLGAHDRPGWVLLESGTARVASLVTTLRGGRQPVAVAVLVGQR